MSFFFTNAATTPHSDKSEKGVEIFHKYQCRVCPLDKIKTNKHPHMAPTGANKPLIYVLGEAPGKTEDRDGIQFVGESGQHLRDLIPKKFDNLIRWNNVVRTRPPENRKPSFQEIECCRPSVTKDIEETKPRAIFGFGGVPLNWAAGMDNMTAWRGRRLVLWVGAHPVWYYSFLHPSYVLRKKKEFGGDVTEAVFKSDLKRAFAEVQSLPDPQPEPRDKIYDGVTVYSEGESSIQKIAKFLDKTTNTNSAVGFDIETNMLRPYFKDSKILSMSLSTGDESVAFAVDHSSAKWTLDQKKRLNKLLFDFMVNRKCTLVCHNLSFEMEWMAKIYDELLLRVAPWSDTQAQAYILDERYGGEVLKLNSLCIQHMGLPLKAQSDVDVKDLDHQPVTKVLRYNALDAKYTQKLFGIQEKLIAKQGLKAAFGDQIRRIPATTMAQIRGLDVDQAFVKWSLDQLDKKVLELKKSFESSEYAQLYKKHTGKPINIDSPLDLGVLFFEVLKLPIIKKTETGRASVDLESLSKITHPAAKLILDYRDPEKLKSTYIKKLLLPDGKDIYPDGKIHPNFNTNSTETGRLSASKPSVQNYPKRKNKELARPAFIAPPGHKFVAVDYGQIEARVLAMVSGDKVFSKALWDKYDVHQEWAEKIAKAWPDALDKCDGQIKKLRDKVKNKFVFPAFYGASKRSIAGYMGIPDDVVLELFDEFWSVFEGIHKWQKDLGKFYATHGYVEAPTGRRRRAPLPWAEMINAPIQGGSSDIVVDAMCRLSERAQHEDNPALQARLNIHDDLSFVIPDDELDETLDIIVTEMLKSSYGFITVPLSVEVSIGTNWGNVGAIKEDTATFYSNEYLRDRITDYPLPAKNL